MTDLLAILSYLLSIQGHPQPHCTDPLLSLMIDKYEMVDEEKTLGSGVSSLSHNQNKANEEGKTIAEPSTL